ncbi:unnamed protein product, partial [Phaeothamnion confervicola]
EEQEAETAAEKERKGGEKILLNGKSAAVANGGSVGERNSRDGDGADGSGIRGTGSDGSREGSAAVGGGDEGLSAGAQRAAARSRRSAALANVPRKTMSAG